MTEFAKAESFFQRFGSMVNFGVLVSLAGFLIWIGSYRTTMERDIAERGAQIERVSAEQQRLWADHMAFHRERSNETFAERARMDERIKAVEKLFGQTENITFRLTTVEQAIKDIASSRLQTEEKINKLVTDVAIIKDQLVGSSPRAPR